MNRWIIVFSILAAACATPPKREVATTPIPPKAFPHIANPFLGPFNVNPEGAKRAPAKVYLPLDFARKEQWPLVVLLHGFSGTADTEDLYLTLRFRVSARGFVLLTPDGTATPAGVKGADGRDLSGLQFWNATDFCCDFGKTAVDDVGYLNKLIRLVTEKYNIDPARVYLFGHSNGGFMANRLACEDGPTFAGIASLAGGSFASTEQCTQPKPIKYLQIHALNDKTIPYHDDPRFAGGSATVQQWLARNKCQGASRKTLHQDFLLLAPGNDTALEAWNDCESGKPVAFWTIQAHEGEHHDPHVPIFNLNFTDAVLSFLLN